MPFTQVARRYNSSVISFQKLGFVTVALTTATIMASADVDQSLWRHRVVGKALFENPGTVSQSVAECRQAANLAPNSIRDRLNYGIALLRAGDSKAAISELEKVAPQSASFA